MINKINQKKLFIFNPSIEDGGVEKNLFIITNYLANKIKNVYLITADKRQDKFTYKTNFLYPKFNFSKHHNRPIKYLFCLFVLIKEIFKCKKNCVVFSFQANIYAIIVCFFLKVKIVSRSNSSPSGWSNNLFKFLVFNFFLKKANQIITNSKEFSIELNKKFNITCKTILNPFNFRDIKKRSNEKLKFPFFTKKTLKIINIGRLTDQKDQVTLIKAINIASKKTDIRAIIIGKGSEYEKLKNLIKIYELKNTVKLIGYQNNPFKYLKQADVFVLTSTFEGHPNVLVEAQYLKKFIISSNCPTGPKEILNNGKYGDLFKVGDYKSLSKLILNYKKNRAYSKKITLGYDSLDQYDIENNCNEYLKIIKSYL